MSLHLLLDQNLNSKKNVFVNRVTTNEIIANTNIKCNQITDLSGNQIGGENKKFLIPNNITNVNAEDTVDMQDALQCTIITNPITVASVNSKYIKLIGSKITAENMILCSLVDTDSDMNSNTGHALPFLSTGVKIRNVGQSSGEAYIRIINPDTSGINQKFFKIRILIVE